MSSSGEESLLSSIPRNLVPFDLATNIAASEKSYAESLTALQSPVKGMTDDSKLTQGERLPHSRIPQPAGRRPENQGSSSQNPPGAQAEDAPGTPAAEAGPAGAGATLPPEVVAVTPPDQLPSWFSPLWTTVDGRFKHEERARAELSRKLSQVQSMRNEMNETNTRFKGVEDAVGKFEGILDTHSKQIETMQSQLFKLQMADQGPTPTPQDVKPGRASQVRPASQMAPQGGAQLEGWPTVPAQSEVQGSGMPFKQPEGPLPPLGSVLQGTEQYRDVANSLPSGWFPQLGPIGAVIHGSDGAPTMSPLGPELPGLVPVATMLRTFETVVNYRHYRLTDTSSVPKESELHDMYKMKYKIQAYAPTLGVFSGEDPITLLPFLATFRDVMNDHHKTEGAAVRILPYFLVDRASRAYHSHMSQKFNMGSKPYVGTYPCVVDMLIRKYVSDEVLQKAYDAVARGRQNDREDEEDFYQRLNLAWGNCRFAFDAGEFANFFLRGCKESVREQVNVQITNLTVEQRADPEEIRKLAVSAGRIQRSLVKQATGTTRASSSRVPPRPAKGQGTFHISHDQYGRDVSPPTTPSLVSVGDEAANPITGFGDSVSVVETNIALDSVFAIQELDIREVMESTNMDMPTLFRATKDVPDLTREQIAEALLVVPQDYWQLNCWSCRDEGHSTFTCPYLTLSQRILFAYAYFCNQVRGNPQMREWYKQRARQVQGEDVNPGPKPNNAGSRLMGGARGGRGGGRFGGRGNGRQGAAPGRPGQHGHSQPVPDASVPSPTSVNVIKDGEGTDSSSSENE